MAAQHGSEARDRLWSHPDLLPTAADLDEPLDFVGRQGATSAADAAAEQDEFDRLTAGLDLDGGSGEPDHKDGDDGAAPR
jgi:hypothetical protein